MSRNVHIVLCRKDCHHPLVQDFLSQSLQGDPSIDDPVNDTGLSPRQGDLQVSDEFASQLSPI